MERLTFKNGDYVWCVDNCFEEQSEYYCGPAIDRLAHYEDLEEQGRLVELPCNVGDTVWYIGGTHNTLIKPARVIELVVAAGGVLDLCVETDNNICYEDNIKNFFITREEAEAAVKRG